VKVIREANTGIVLAFNGETDLGRIEQEFINVFKDFLVFMGNFRRQQVNTAAFEQYSARNVTAILAGLLEKCIETL
jgi:hypothetical protein